MRADDRVDVVDAYVGRAEINSKDLGDMVLEHLKPLDDVAYIRFASVYKDFQSIEEFQDALKGLK